MQRHGFSDDLKGYEDQNGEEKSSFKYILLEVKDPKTKEKKLLMRGSKAFNLHSEILDDFKSKSRIL